MMEKRPLLVILLLSSLLRPFVYGQQLRLESLHQSINSESYDEIAPCISDDGLTLYFTRLGCDQFDQTLIENGIDQSKALSPDQYLSHLSEIYTSLSGSPIHNPVNSVFNQDIWIANTAKTDFDLIIHPGPPLNNALPNSISSIVHNSNEVILVNQFIAEGGMQKGFSKSYLSENGMWVFPEPISINNYHNSGPDVNLTVSNDEQVIVLSLEREDAVGRSDLYVCFKLENGSWSEPKNLGSGVNTPFREATPHLSKDGNQLFYSSDRGEPSGNNNIYVQTRLDDTWQKWTTPRKFIAPVNSDASDSHPYFCPASGHLYFCSNRNNNWDIFRVQIDNPEFEVLNIKGVVLDKETMQSIDGVQILCEQKGIHPSVRYSVEGNFRMTLPWETKATLRVSKEGYEKESMVVVTGPKMNANFVKELQFLLIPIKSDESDQSDKEVVELERKAEAIKDKPEIGKKIDLHSIYFLQSKAIVRKDSYKELDRLADYLKEHPTIRIRVSGHTDNQGEEAALLKLSEDRAKAIKDYLVLKQFIDPYRIETVGYGASQPINDNSTDKLRMANRRVEVEVTAL
jgi:outer membrane protein OmpA-like peptidoglycan-associated protein